MLIKMTIEDRFFHENTEDVNRTGVISYRKVS
jgi:hypothetical protein